MLLVELEVADGPLVELDLELELAEAELAEVELEAVQLEAEAERSLSSRRASAVLDL